MSALMQLPLAMPEVQVLATECRPAGPLLIPVASTRQGTYCSQGGRELHPWQGDDRPMQGRHLPMLGRPVSRAMRPQRYRCRPGEGRPTPTPRCEWDEPNRPPTQALEKGSWRNRVNSTGAAVSPQLGWGPAAVAGIRGRWVSTPVDWRQLTPREIGGIAEMALTRGPGNYVAVLSSRDPPGQVVLLARQPDRRPVTVQALLESMPAPLPATI
jgi:hypothetical protein